jgi:hypothetical protein
MKIDITITTAKISLDVDHAAFTQILELLCKLKYTGTAEVGSASLKGEKRTDDPLPNGDA